MNIYDFDNTIYDGDSNKDIIKFGLKKHFMLTLKSLKKAKKLKKDYEMGLVSFEKIKETMLEFIFKIDNPNEFISKFVDANIKKIKPWYQSRKTDNDIIVTASYELWVKEFAKRLGVREVIGTRTDEYGKILGRNCKGEEKVIRLKKMYPNNEINTVYADDETDVPILKLGKTAYVVNKNKLTTYTSSYKF